VNDFPKYGSDAPVKRVSGVGPPDKEENGNG